MKSTLQAIVFSIFIILHTSYTVAADTKDKVAEHYTNIAHAVFGDALITAKSLKKHVDTLLNAASEKNLEAAKVAWKAARVPYQQSEVFRFGNANVDD